MNQVEYHLKLTIYLWCGATPQQYTIDSQLRDIWAAHIPGVGYEPVGIQRFMYQLYHDALFGPCAAAHNMTPGEFLTGGDLQTVKAVYGRLLNCGSSPGPTSIMSDVTLPWADEVQASSTSGTAPQKKGRRQAIPRS
jgi:hypothetical protein